MRAPVSQIAFAFSLATDPFAEVASISLTPIRSLNRARNFSAELIVGAFFERDVHRQFSASAL